MNETTTFRLAVQAALKIDVRTESWCNAVAFIQSCYACHVRNYDLDLATATMAKLTDEEQRALIIWVLLVDASRSGT